MKVSYTLVEINAANKLGNLVMAEVGFMGKKAPQFKTTEEAADFINKHDKNKSKHVVLSHDAEYVHMEMSEELILDTIEMFGRHIPALVGFMMAVKGIMQMCKSMLTSVKEDFLGLAKKYK